ncbi:hypothetical protein ACM66B_003181 [Microbotryomycetes sp. NB124-2]
MRRDVYTSEKLDKHQAFLLELERRVGSLVNRSLYDRGALFQDFINDLRRFSSRSIYRKYEIYNSAAAIDALHGFNQALLEKGLEEPRLQSLLETLFLGQEGQVDFKFNKEAPHSNSQVELLFNMWSNQISDIIANDDWRHVMLRELHVARLAFNELWRRRAGLTLLQKLSSMIFVVMDVLLLDFQRLLTYTEGGKHAKIRKSHSPHLWKCNFDALGGELAKYLDVARDEFARESGQTCFIGGWINYRSLDLLYEGKSASELVERVTKEREAGYGRDKFAATSREPPRLRRTQSDEHQRGHAPGAFEVKKRPNQFTRNPTV